MVYNQHHLIWLAKNKKKQSLIKKRTILFITDSLNPETFNKECKYLFDIKMLIDIKDKLIGINPLLK